MKQALKRGESVEFPFGYLERVRHSHRKQRGWFLHRITTTYKKPYTVRHRLDAVGRFCVLGHGGIRSPIDRLGSCVVGGVRLEVKGRNLGGRKYLKSKLGELGISRRKAVSIVNRIFREMGLALRRGEYVECPFGYLMAEKRVSRRWQAIGDEPMRPYFVKLMVDEEGEQLFAGGERTPWPEGWSRKVDKRSLVYRRDQSLKRSGKAERTRRPKPEESRKVASKRARSGK